MYILCTPPLYWPFGWPKVRGPKDADYTHYEDSTNAKLETRAAANKFINEQSLEGFKDMQYLPDVKNGVVRLIYLLSITSADGRKLPYTKRQHDVFVVSARADFITALILNIAMMLLPIWAMVGLFSALGLIHSLTTTEQLMVPVGISAFVGALAAALGVISTGTNPHFASMAANEKQNTIKELEDDYNTLAIDLLELYNSSDTNVRKFAKRVASQLKVRYLRKMIKKQTAWDLCEPLREAKRFILHKDLCFHSLVIRLYLTRATRKEFIRKQALLKAETYFKQIVHPDDRALDFIAINIPSSEDEDQEQREDELQLDMMEQQEQHSE
jgi:hypothetical protein